MTTTSRKHPSHPNDGSQHSPPISSCPEVCGASHSGEVEWRWFFHRRFSGLRNSCWKWIRWFMKCVSRLWNARRWRWQGLNFWKHGTSIHMAHGVYVRTSHWSLGGVVAYVAKTTWCIIMLQQDLHLGLQDMNVSLSYRLLLMDYQLANQLAVGRANLLLNGSFMIFIISNGAGFCPSIWSRRATWSGVFWTFQHIPRPYIILASMSSCEIAPNRAKRTTESGFRDFDVCTVAVKMDKHIKSCVNPNPIQ